MSNTVVELVPRAKAQIENLTPDQVAREAADGAVVVDLREPAELHKDGMIEGAVHAPRGMLEFWIDPESPYHKPQFAEDKRFVFFCGGGWRSALAAQAAHRMGLKPVAHIGGGFGAWKKAGGPVEAWVPKQKS